MSITCIETFISSAKLNSPFFVCFLRSQFIFWKNKKIFFFTSWIIDKFSWNSSLVSIIHCTMIYNANLNWKIHHAANVNSYFHFEIWDAIRLAYDLFETSNECQSIESDRFIRTTNYENKQENETTTKNLMRKWSFWCGPHCLRPEFGLIVEYFSSAFFFCIGNQQNSFQLYNYKMEWFLPSGLQKSTWHSWHSFVCWLHFFPQHSN